MNQRTRKAIGCFVLLTYLALYITVASTVGAALLSNTEGWVAAAFFIGAGVIWVLPLKPLFAWVNRPD